MLIYDDLVELARLCARNSRIATSRDVADELWRMAREYQAQAANLVERFQSSNHMGCSKRPHPWDGKSKMQLWGFMESVV